MQIYETIVYTHEDHIVTVMLNRPHARGTPAHRNGNDDVHVVAQGQTQRRCPGFPRQEHQARLAEPWVVDPLGSVKDIDHDCLQVRPCSSRHDMSTIDLLDNPVWYAINSVHTDLALQTGEHPPKAGRYRPEISSFAGIETPDALRYRAILQPRSNALFRNPPSVTP